MVGIARVVISFGRYDFALRGRVEVEYIALVCANVLAVAIGCCLKNGGKIFVFFQRSSTPGGFYLLLHVFFYLLWHCGLSPAAADADATFTAAGVTYFYC
jgi:hypothetical protein